MDAAGYLTGQLLVATPTIQFSCFEKAVVLVCLHGGSGAMGLIINHEIEHVKAWDIFEQFGIAEKTGEKINLPVHFGGPLDTNRGFVLHSRDYHAKDTLAVSEKLSLTSSMDILKDIARDSGPQRKLLALGHAGWAPNQLEAEIEDNSWFNVPPSDAIIFGKGMESRWLEASKIVGVNPFMFSDVAGHA